MANTVITNYTDLNGPSTKTDSSVVVIVNKDGSLSVDQKLLGTLMGSDGSQAAGISVVRVGHEGRPDDATDSENEDDKIPHVTLSVDSYYDEPNSIIKYDSGAEMLQSLKIETRENSLVGFHNDHCYTSLTSPSQVLPHRNEAFAAFDDPVIEITHTPPPKPIQQSKKITILEQQIIPKGKKIIINPIEASVILKGHDVLNKPLPVLTKSKHVNEVERKSEVEKKIEDNTDSSSISSSSESAPDRDSDSDYKDTKDRSLSIKLKRSKIKPRILKNSQSIKDSKIDIKVTPKLKSNRSLVRRDIRDKIQQKRTKFEKKDIDTGISLNKERLSSETPSTADQTKMTPRQVPKVLKKEKKTPAHVTALLSDMTSLFSTPDVIRRVSTDNKILPKPDKEAVHTNKKISVTTKPESSDSKLEDISKGIENAENLKGLVAQKTYSKQNIKNVITTEKPVKSYEAIPQLDDVSLAQILQEATPTPMKIQPSISSSTNVINSSGLAGPLSPTLDLLAGLQPEEEGLTEDLLMHVAQLVESSENLQEVIDKQVLGKVDSLPSKTQPLTSIIPQQSQVSNATSLQTPSKTMKNILPRKDPIEIVRRDGRIITLPPIEAPATRASKRKNQVESSIPICEIVSPTPAPISPVITPPDPVLQHVSKQYVNKKLSMRKQEPVIQAPTEKSAESQESWNSEDDPNRLWCICKQPHNNRFMICCDSCEDWFHGKCVNITKAMGQQMEDQGIEWRCPNCVKSMKTVNKNNNKVATTNKSVENQEMKTLLQPVLPKDIGSKTNCIVCKKSARASSIYCSDACILKHAQDSLGGQVPSKTDGDTGKMQEKLKSESRVIVYERKTGRLLAGPNAPTAENLKSWLQKNPTFEVVRPGTLSTIKPNPSRKKSSGDTNKIQTTLNFERIPRKPEQSTPKTGTLENKEKVMKPLPLPKEENKPVTHPKTPVTPKSQQQQQIFDTPKTHNTGSVTKTNEPRKLARTTSRSQSTVEKMTSVSPSTPRRKDISENKMRMNSAEPIRDNVRKALQEQMSIRMAETSGLKFTEEEIQQFACDTEFELHELFRDVGMKYKAKYRSLMFNIKDRKNLSLWQKICDHTITPQQLVRLSPEELASQELAQWRDQEAKHQLELIKKSELDLLAASKTYVLKTHKGEEVMETKESVSTELDPNVPVEDLVSALNDSMGNEQPTEEAKDVSKKTEPSSHKKYGSNKKKDKENGSSGQSKNKRESKRDSDSRKSRSSRKRSDKKDKEQRSTHKTDRKSSRSRSKSKDKSKIDSSKEKPDSSENSKHRSRSRVKSKRHSKESSRSISHGRERSRSSGRSRRRSRSKESSRHRQRSRSKHSLSTEEKVKYRSRSQENTYNKSKNDSTDSDSIERPKSAMLKEMHPEYDPHEPMITSAFSEEDLRKSREDVYEDNYKTDIADYSEVDYDASKSFSIGTSMLATETYIGKQDKVSEVESDQEPSSTVENSAPIVWNGCINMVDVARFYVAAHEVSGNAVELEDDLAAELDVVGRINPETVWDYINKMKRAGNKDIVILRLQAANDEEKMQYIALYSYLSSRSRLGVVKVSNTATVKDIYIVPLSANTSLPPVLLPLEGPGLGEVKTHLLIAIIIRKRLTTNIPKETIPAKVVRESRKRSYTPPMDSTGSYTPPTSPKRRAPLPLPTYTSPALSTSVKDKIAATLASVEDDEAYSPGSSTSSGSAPASNNLRCKMEELNRQIEEQKQQILKMAQADSSAGGEDEAYSPSRPMTPPNVVPLSDIALPSNLQEILANIKQRTETSADVDMRTLQPPQSLPLQEDVQYNTRIA